MSYITSTQEIIRFNDEPSLLARLMVLDEMAVRWMASHSVTLLRISVGIVFLWFGALKLVPDLSPAQPLIDSAISFLPIKYFLPFLAMWEMVIGLGFITGKFQRATIILLMLQMGGAMSPILLSPDRIWDVFPYALTLEGQYVIKDIILISAGLVIGATVRGGHLTAEAE